jgi:hypothetical protein
MLEFDLPEYVNDYRLLVKDTPEKLALWLDQLSFSDFGQFLDNFHTQVHRLNRVEISAKVRDELNKLLETRIDNILDKFFALQMNKQLVGAEKSSYYQMKIQLQDTVVELLYSVRRVLDERLSPNLLSNKRSAKLIECAHQYFRYCGLLLLVSSYRYHPLPQNFWENILRYYNEFTKRDIDQYTVEPDGNISLSDRFVFMLAFNHLDPFSLQGNEHLVIFRYLLRWSPVLDQGITELENAQWAFNGQSNLMHISNDASKAKAAIENALLLSFEPVLEVIEQHMSSLKEKTKPEKFGLFGVHSTTQAEWLLDKIHSRLSQPQRRGESRQELEQPIYLKWGYEHILPNIERDISPPDQSLADAWTLISASPSGALIAHSGLETSSTLVGQVGLAQANQSEQQLVICRWMRVLEDKTFIGIERFSGQIRRCHMSIHQLEAQGQEQDKEAKQSQVIIIETDNGQQILVTKKDHLKGQQSASIYRHGENKFFEWEAFSDNSHWVSLYTIEYTQQDDFL